MIKLVKVAEDKKEMLSNILQKYLYEMTLYYDNKLDDNGEYPYAYLDKYFDEPERFPFFIYKDDELIGFTLVNDYAFTDIKIDHSIAEFTIFPAYRNKGYASETFSLLIKILPGVLQLKFSEKNINGAKFWRKIEEKYNGREIKLDDSEICIIFSNT